MHGIQAQQRKVILEKHLGTLRESCGACGTGALRRAISVIIMQHGTFVNHTFDLGVAIATFLSVLSIVPHHCACFTYFLHPKLRKIKAVLITPQLISCTLRRVGSPSYPTALKDCPKGPPTANRQPLPTATIHQSSTTNRRQPPPTATNLQSPTGNRQSPIKDPPGARHGLSRSPPVGKWAVAFSTATGDFQGI